MKTLHRNPQIEESSRALVFQNRCGNRLSLLIDESSTALEFVYKPNARRRKDYRARNFSNRDNQTELFAAAALPEWGEKHFCKYAYDPFFTRLEGKADSGGENVISILNVVDENVFVLTADRPLTLAFTPRGQFELEDGLLWEEASDRGEEFISFVSFSGLEENRYRVLDDGRHVLQIFANEPVYIGGEENHAAMERAMDPLQGLTLEELIARNEALLEEILAPGRVMVNDAEYQHVLDLNRRIVISGMDEGGACFGALNRVYYLIWNRDGAMTSANAARAGNPRLVETFAPFILENPSWQRGKGGDLIPEYLQILGSRWTKGEDDGIYYAALAIFTLWQTSGDVRLFTGPAFETYLEALDHNVATRFDDAEGLFGSSTRGEDTLRSHPMYGYDSVNGIIDPHTHHREARDGMLAKCYALYHNVNLYNTLLMTAACLREVRPEATERIERYLALAAKVAETLATRYVDPETGCYYTDYVILDDGTKRWVRFTDEDVKPDYWEYAWANSAGPFIPHKEIARRSAAYTIEKWPGIRSYGWCPWNTMTRALNEFGLPAARVRELIDPEVGEALTEARKYPMVGALTEYSGATEGWRPLPFTAGSFWLMLAARVLAGLPFGVAVRPGGVATEVQDFRFRSSRLFARVEGEGDSVGGLTIDGQPLRGTLQIPENRLLAGRQEVVIETSSDPEGFALVASDLRLLRVEELSEGFAYEVDAPIPGSLLFNAPKAVAKISLLSQAPDSAASVVALELMADDTRGLLKIASPGRYRVEITCK